jgi:Mn-dependent DtxR family transcriptional regulator
MAVTQSVADYLEAIMMLQREKVNVRSVDIANHFGYSRPTVSQTLKTFRAKGYVEVDEDGFVKLTALGEEIAQSTYEKHVVLTGLLKAIGVSDETAKEDACKLEHDISDETFEAIKRVYQQMMR